MKSPEVLQLLQMKMFTCKTTYIFYHILFITKALKNYRYKWVHKLYHLLNVLGPKYGILFHLDNTLWVCGEKDSHVYARDKETEIKRG